MDVMGEKCIIRPYSTDYVTHVLEGSGPMRSPNERRVILSGLESAVKRIDLVLELEMLAGHLEHLDIDSSESGKVRACIY